MKCAEFLEFYGEKPTKRQIQKSSIFLQIRPKIRKNNLFPNYTARAFLREPPEASSDPFS